MNDPTIIVALDFATRATALACVARLDPALCRVKVGKELFTAAGPQLVEELVRLRYSVFLDLKFHDIPNTVAGACKAAAQLGVWMLNVHALGGRQMLAAAREALEGSRERPKLIAVTLLTSMTATDAADVGLAGDPADVALRLARLAQATGLDGVVCSAREAALLRSHMGPLFCLVTPGIRPAQARGDDQQRIMTPAAAICAGADYLVIGRPITQAADPMAALAAIHSEIATSKG
jgi:orotidine-5'-phosphate decarboxylase